MKIKKIILKIALFFSIWIFGLSFIAIIVKDNNSHNISSAKGDFYKSDYFKNTYLNDKLNILVDYNNTKNYIADYDNNKVEFSVVNLSDNNSEDFSINSIKRNHKSAYNDVFIYDSYYSDRIDEKYKDSKYLAVPKKTFFDIMNKYTEKNRRKISKDDKDNKNKEYNIINDVEEEDYNNDEVKSYYGWIDEDFDDNCKIFKSKDNNIFIYSSREGTYYNKYLGWVDEETYNNCNNIYVPMKYINNSSQEAKEQSILTAPCFFSLKELYLLNYSNYLDKKNDIEYCETQLSNKNTNFVYVIQDISTGKVITNNNWKANYFSEVLKLNGGAVYNRDNNTQTNLNENNIKVLNKLKGNYKVGVGVKEFNDELEFDNGLSNSKFVYNLIKYFKYIIAVFLVDIIAIILLLTVLIKDEFKEKKLNKIDKYPFDIFFIIAALCTTTFFGIGMNFYYKHRWGVLLILVSILAYVVNIEMISSFVRRISTKSLIRGIFIIRLFKKLERYIKYIYDRRSFSSKKILKLVVFSLLNIILAGLAVLSLSISGHILFIFSIIALIVLNGFALKKLVDDLNGTKKIINTAKEISNGNLKVKVNTKELSSEEKDLAEAINSIGDGLSKAVETSIRDERMKAELITNVSHDIKTPLTSIINYVDLLKREKINNEKANEYLNVLDKKSQRLKQLIEDLVEASKASTGNIEFHKVPLNVNELFNQIIAEYYEKFESKNLKLISNISKEIMSIYADGRRCYRVIDNLFQNIYKYALEGSRVYLNVYKDRMDIVMELKNISKEELNIDACELTERFVRGEKSRTSEGSGLGLSIAKNLVTLQGGKFDLLIDGDLFKVIIRFKENANI